MLNLVRMMLVVLFSFSGTVFAAAESIPSDRKITKISTYSSYAIIRYAPAYNNSQGCTYNADTMVRLELTSDGARQMLAAVIAAATAQRSIGFGVNGCLHSGKYTNVYRIDVDF